MSYHRKPSRSYSYRQLEVRSGFPFRRTANRKVLPTHQKFRVSGINYTGQKVSLVLNGEKLENKVEVVPHEFWVGHWRRTQPIVTLDDDLPMKYRETTAIHETIEKQLVQHHGLSEDEAHLVAQRIEHDIFLRTHSEEEWDHYNEIVEVIFRKELEHKLQHSNRVITK
jgi:hypothetical protein